MNVHVKQKKEKKEKKRRYNWIAIEPPLGCHAVTARVRPFSGLISSDRTGNFACIIAQTRKYPCDVCVVK